MKTRAMILIVLVCFLLFAWGCTTTKSEVVFSPPPDPCPMPSGYQLAEAVETAERTLATCPGKLDQVFMKLLDIAKERPDKENGVLVQDLLKNLIKQNKISETYSKALYQKYFSRRFVTMPDVKIYNLTGEMDSIKKSMREELACKKIGMVACCGDRESYRRAEAEYTRAVQFMENLAYNEEYVKGNN